MHLHLFFFSDPKHFPPQALSDGRSLQPFTVEPRWKAQQCSGSANETLIKNQSAELLKSLPLPMEIGTLSKLNLTRSVLGMTWHDARQAAYGGVDMGGTMWNPFSVDLVAPWFTHGLPANLQTSWGADFEGVRKEVSVGH